MSVNRTFTTITKQKAANVKTLCSLPRLTLSKANVKNVLCFAHAMHLVVIVVSKLLFELLLPRMESVLVFA